MIILKISRYFVMGLILSVFGVGFTSAQTTAGTEMQFSGTLVDQPCTINSNDVEFGNEILTTRINGTDYKKQPLSYTVSCNDGDSGAGMQITITGDEASFGSGLLKTDIDGLGVRFVNDDGTDLPVNSGTALFNYASDTLPVISALLTRDSSIVLPGGVFNAVATMYVSYQ